MFDAKDFQNKFPKDVYDICLFLSREGFTLTLVGGSVRDYLLTGKLSRDLDFEIKHKFYYEEDKWERMLQRVFKKVEENFTVKIEEKGFYIFSFNIGEYQLEFSSPRIEEFIDGDHSHKNFKSTFVSNLETEKAFKRRDFTLNSIGVFFGMPGAIDEFSILDPFKGVNDLTNRKLKHIDEDCFKDPVRLLRLIRFKRRFNFSIDKELESLLTSFNLKELSNYNLVEETKKSKDIYFLKELLELVSVKNIETSKSLDSLNFFINIKDNNYFYSTDYLEWIASHKNLKEEDKIVFCEIFGLSRKKLKKISDCFSLLESEISHETLLKFTEVITQVVNVSKFKDESIVRFLNEYNALKTDYKGMTKDQILQSKLEKIVKASRHILPI